MISRSFKDISFDLSPHPITQDLVVTNNVNAIKRSVLNLVLTNKGERPYQDELGSNVSARLFELVDYSTASQIEMDVREVLDLYEPRITVDAVEVTPDFKRYGYSINIKFTIIGSNIEADLATYLQSTRG